MAAAMSQASPDVTRLKRLGLCALVLVALSVSPGLTPLASARMVSQSGIPARLHGRVVAHDVSGPDTSMRHGALVLLPQGGLTPGERYPLLVLLHAHGSPPAHWLSRGRVDQVVDRLVRAGKMPPCIVLLASGGFGYWVNWHDGIHRFGDLVVQRHLDLMRRHYPVYEDPALVALAGASMGGFGALSLGLRNPERFGFVAAFSATDMAIALRGTPHRRLYRRVVGPGAVEPMLDRINPRNLVHAGLPSPSQQVSLVWGTREARKFRVGGERLSEAMVSAGLDVSALRIRGGGHGWRSWRSALPWVATRLGQRWLAELSARSDP